jgi:hypothetical protein
MKSQLVNARKLCPKIGGGATDLRQKSAKSLDLIQGKMKLFFLDCGGTILECRS